MQSENEVATKLSHYSLLVCFHQQLPSATNFNSWQYFYNGIEFLEHFVFRKYVLFSYNMTNRNTKPTL